MKPPSFFSLYGWVIVLGSAEAALYWQLLQTYNPGPALVQYYDFFLNCVYAFPFAMAVLILKLERREGPLDRRFRPAGLAANLVLFAVLVTESLFRNVFGDMRLRALIAWIVIASLFFITVPAGETWRRARRFGAGVAVAALGGLSGFLYQNTNNFLWERLGRFTGSIISAALRLVGMDVRFFIDPVKSPPILLLTHPNFSVNIWTGCSGLEGFFFLVFVISLVVVLDWEHFYDQHFLNRYLIAFVYMIGGNILRIGAVFLVGVWIRQHSTDPEMHKLVVDLFHHWAGWILHLVLATIFVVLMYSRKSRELKSAGVSTERAAGSSQ